MQKSSYYISNSLQRVPLETYISKSYETVYTWIKSDIPSERMSKSLISKFYPYSAVLTREVTIKCLRRKIII
jgi:hypothetical protein